MRNNKSKQKERKSIKETMIENRGKIIAGVGVLCCGACYIIASNRYQTELKEVTKDLIDKVKEIDELKIKNMMLEEDVQTLSAILSEGALQDAITTTSNKINSRLSKLRMYEERVLNGDLKVKEKIQKIKGDLDILFKRKDLYETKLYKYEIKDLVE